MALNISFGGFNHVQSTPATEWTITHKLGCKPVVDVYVTHNSVLTKVLPQDITFPDNQTCVITFTTAQSGEARCV